MWWSWCLQNYLSPLVWGRRHCVAWGGSEGGGESEAVRGKLAARIEQLYSADKSLAARACDGSFETWVYQQHGGNSAAVADQLKAGVVRVYSTRYGHAALKDDGSVVSWGMLASGQIPQLQKVQMLRDIL